MALLKANFYIDGFSLYYGCVKDSQYKWLDLAALCRKAYPSLQINRIRYFTARTSALPTDPNIPHRQQLYLRALKTIPDLTIHYGFFQSKPTSMPLETPPLQGSKYVRVVKTEEKGSDVNLASYLLLDGFQRDYEVAIVVSNDADLAEPIKLVRQELGFPVGVLVPAVKKGRLPSKRLMKVSEQRYYRPIRVGALRVCQFPSILTDVKGQFSKPNAW